MRQRGEPGKKPDPKTTECVILFMRIVQSRKTWKDKTQISGGQRAGE